MPCGKETAAQDFLEFLRKGRALINALGSLIDSNGPGSSLASAFTGKDIKYFHCQLVS